MRNPCTIELCIFRTNFIFVNRYTIIKHIRISLHLQNPSMRHYLLSTQDFLVYFCPAHWKTRKDLKSLPGEVPCSSIESLKLPVSFLFKTFFSIEVEVVVRLGRGKARGRELWNIFLSACKADDLKYAFLV